MKIPRRKFISSGLIGLGGLILGARSYAQSLPEIKTFDPWEIVPLGKTGIKVSRVGLGTGMNGFNQQSNQTRLGADKFRELIRGCYDRGVRLFDTADLYGSHPYLIPALSGIKRENYVIVSKIWYNRGGIPIPENERPDADKMVQRFLKELGTDYIDLVLLHCMTDENWPTKFEKQLKLLEDLKQKGLIRAHGVSCHSLEALKTAASEPWVDSVHARINPYGESMDGDPDVVVPVLQRFHQAGKGVVGMKIIGAGKFRTSDLKRNNSIDFTLNLGCVDTMIVGFEKLEEVDDFAIRVQNTPRRNPTPLPKA